MKFLADEMCGDINRWLRMLGYDTTIPQDHPNNDGTTPNDDEIIEICIHTHRILISKDFEIIQKMNLKSEKLQNSAENFAKDFDLEHLDKDITPCILLRSTDIQENLSEIHKKFKIEMDYNIVDARCPKCNAVLEKILDPREIEDHIPPSVFEFHSDFWKCSNSDCGQYFWKGTHLDRIKQTLKSIQEKD